MSLKYSSRSGEARGAESRSRETISEQHLGCGYERGILRKVGRFIMLLPGGGGGGSGNRPGRNAYGRASVEICLREVNIIRLGREWLSLSGTRTVRERKSFLTNVPTRRRARTQACEAGRPFDFA